MALGDTVVKTLAQYAPNLPGLDPRRTRSSLPKISKTTYGLTGGHIFHGELALDQFFTMRPLLDWARYQTPIDESVPLRQRNASGRRPDRRIRRKCRARDSEAPEKVVDEGTDVPWSNGLLAEPHSRMTGDTERGWQNSISPAM